VSSGAFPGVAAARPENVMQSAGSIERPQPPGCDAAAGLRQLKQPAFGIAQDSPCLSGLRGVSSSSRPPALPLHEQCCVIQQWLSWGSSHHGGQGWLLRESGS